MYMYPCINFNMINNDNSSSFYQGFLLWIFFKNGKVSDIVMTYRVNTYVFLLALHSKVGIQLMINYQKGLPRSGWF